MFVCCNYVECCRRQPELLRSFEQLLGIGGTTCSDHVTEDQNQDTGESLLYASCRGYYFSISVVI